MHHLHEIDQGYHLHELQPKPQQQVETQDPQEATIRSNATELRPNWLTLAAWPLGPLGKGGKPPAAEERCHCSHAATDSSH